MILVGAVQVMVDLKEIVNVVLRKHDIHKVLHMLLTLQAIRF